MEYAVVLMSNLVNCKTNREDTAIAKAVAFALSKVDKMKIPVSEETRRKISEANSGENNPMYGRHFSEEQKKKMSEALKGRILSEETKNMISKARVGKHHSEETRKKLSKANKGKINAPTKSVVQYSKDGEFITEYTSTREAERQTGCNHQNISKCCKGKLKSAGGYIWRYAS